MNFRLIAILGTVGLTIGFWFGFSRPMATLPTHQETRSRNASPPQVQPSLLGSSRNPSPGNRPQTDLPRSETSFKVNEALQRFFTQWGVNDANAAFEIWAQTPEARKDSIHKDLIIALRLQIGFDASLSLMLTIDEASVRSDALRTLASQVHETNDPKTAIDTLLINVADEERKEVLSDAIQSWTSKAEFNEVVDWIDNHMESFTTDGVAALERSATNTLVEANPEAAAEWLMERATEESYPEHIEYVVESWARFTPNATAEWLSTLPPSPQNDPAIDSFARLVAPDDPESAAHWATTIIDDRIRANTLSAVLSLWKKRDPQAAAQFEASKLP